MEYLYFRCVADHRLSSFGAWLSLSKTYMYFMKYEKDGLVMKAIVSKWDNLRLMFMSSQACVTGPCLVVREPIQVTVIA